MHKLNFSKRGVNNEIKRRILELFQESERSGLSQEFFCSERGIPIAKFKYQ